MNNLPELGIAMKTDLFPWLEGIEKTIVKTQDFLSIEELVPSVNPALRRNEPGRSVKGRKKMLRIFFLKTVYILLTGWIEHWESVFLKSAPLPAL